MCLVCFHRHYLHKSSRGETKCSRSPQCIRCNDQSSQYFPIFPIFFDCLVISRVDRNDQRAGISVSNIERQSRDTASRACHFQRVSQTTQQVQPDGDEQVDVFDQRVPVSKFPSDQRLLLTSNIRRPQEEKENVAVSQSPPEIEIPVFLEAVPRASLLLLNPAAYRILRDFWDTRRKSGRVEIESCDRGRAFCWFLLTLHSCGAWRSPEERLERVWRRSRLQCS